MQTRKNLGKPIYISTFKTLASKPKTPKKGVVYFVEPIQSMTNDPTIQGDVFKKFVNGKLVKQIFVSKNRMKKIIETAKKKYRKHGGLQQPINRTFKKLQRPKIFKRQLPKKRTIKQQPVIINQPPPVYVNQPPPPGQLPAQQIYAADNTTTGQAATQGFAGGLGFVAAVAVVEGVMNAFTGND